MTGTGSPQECLLSTPSEPIICDGGCGMSKCPQRADVALFAFLRRWLRRCPDCGAHGCKGTPDKELWTP